MDVRHVVISSSSTRTCSVRHSKVPEVCDCSEEVLRQLEIVKSEALQDKRLIHYLQHGRKVQGP